MSKYLSRKFIVTIFVSIASVAVPILFKNQEVSDTVSIMVLGIIGGIGTAYGIINLKESKIDKGQ